MSVKRTKLPSIARNAALQQEFIGAYAVGHSVRGAALSIGASPDLADAYFHRNQAFKFRCQVARAQKSGLLYEALFDRLIENPSTQPHDMVAHLKRLDPEGICADKPIQHNVIHWDMKQLLETKAQLNEERKRLEADVS